MDRALLVYDGDCSLCTSAAAWAASAWRTDARAVSWQELAESDLARLGLTVADAKASVWWVDPTSGPLSGHRAVASALRASIGWRRALGRSIERPPIAWVAPMLYRAAVRHRHRLPGASSACRPPRSADRRAASTPVG